MRKRNSPVFCPHSLTPFLILILRPFSKPCRSGRESAPILISPFNTLSISKKKTESWNIENSLEIPGTDPRRQLAQSLIDDFPAEGSVLVYNQAFEKGILKALAALYPEHSDALINISERIVDLMIPFRNKHFYSPALEGKYSIKNVLPALVPEMADAYKKLDLVHNGLGSDENLFSSEGKGE